MTGGFPKIDLDLNLREAQELLDKSGLDFEKTIEEKSKEVRVFNSRSNKFKDLPKLNQGRRLHCCTVYE